MKFKYELRVKGGQIRRQGILDTLFNACVYSSTVRVVKSSQSGSGKTLYILRREEMLQQLCQTTESRIVSLPLHERKVDFSYVTRNLLQYVDDPEESCARIFHIDVTNEVIKYLIFNLLTQMSVGYCHVLLLPIFFSLLKERYLYIFVNLVWLIYLVIQTLSGLFQCHPI